MFVANQGGCRNEMRRNMKYFYVTPNIRHNFAASKGTKDIPQTGKREKEIINNKLKKRLNMKKLMIILLGCLPMMLHAQNAKFCKSYSDFVANRWTPVESLTEGRTNQMCQVKLRLTRFLRKKCWLWNIWVISMSTVETCAVMTLFSM